MRALVSHWSPLTHISHYMTTNWLAEAKQMRASVHSAMHRKVFLAACSSCHKRQQFRACTLVQNMTACKPLGQAAVTLQHLFSCNVTHVS